MDNFEAFILGLAQGLTEFLPVSSSGHMAVLQNLFNIHSNTIFITLLGHLGSLIAILFYYRNEFYKIFKDLLRSRTSLLVNPTIRLISLVFVASVPSAIVGLGFREFFNQIFSSTQAIGVCFSVTALILALSKLKSTAYQSMSTNTEYISHHITYKQAFLIGLGQAFAICPGVSRAGTTITVGLFVGLNKQHAAFFSFLISIPAILGASLLELKHLEPIGEIAPLLTLFFSSLFFGFVGLWGVIFILQRGKLHYFSFYLIPLSIYVLTYL